jgi:hypothetical protein
MKRISTTSVLLTSLLLLAGGVGGLYLLITRTLPTLGNRWLFFFLLTLAVSGLTLPVAYGLHRRFPSRGGTALGVLVREVAWAGLYVDFLAWLQMGRVLTTPIAALLAAAVVAVEFLWLWRERVRWRPSEEEP